MYKAIPTVSYVLVFSLLGFMLAESKATAATREECRIIKDIELERNWKPSAQPTRDRTKSLVSYELPTFTLDTRSPRIPRKASQGIRF